MSAGKAFDARRSDVTSACWIVAGSCVFVGSKVAPCPGMSRMIKDVITLSCILILVGKSDGVSGKLAAGQ
jgi:hypothetical protein